MQAYLSLVAGLIFVDIVAKMKYEIQLVLCHSLIGCIISLFKALA